MRRRKLSENPVLALLAEREKITIHDAAEALGVSGDDAAQVRALRRLLQSLVKRGEMEVTGAARSRAYRRPRLPAPADAPAEIIPFSAPAREVRAYVSQPKPLRKHVGYNGDFLESYQPNKAGFLSVAQRKKLAELGHAEAAPAPAGTYARNHFRRLLLELSWNSSRLEGNRYSLLETRKLLEDGVAAEGKEASETQMLLNHSDAIRFIVEEAREIEITKFTICQIHALLSNNLLGDPEACGRIRMVPVEIGESNYLPLGSHIELVKTMDLFVAKARKIKDPFEQCFFSLVHLSYLQAFEDVNKRTSRMVANIPLVKANLTPLSFAEVPAPEYLKALLGVYERNDVSMLLDVFLWAYERSVQRFSAVQKSMGEGNLLKLKYREPIRSVIQALVRKKAAPARLPAEIQRLLADHSIAPADAARLVEVIEAELAGLHEGNAILYGLKPAELLAWRGKKDGRKATRRTRLG